MLRDAAYGLRLFRRNPGFSLLSVLITALGIGATTAIFSLINGVLLSPLPYREADRLTVIWSDFSAIAGNPKAFSAPADYFDWRERSRSFQSMAAYANANRTFTAFDQPVTPLTHEVTADFFDVLGVQAIRGRTFVAGEGQPGRDQVAIISYSLWKSAFGGADVVGQSIELDGRSIKVIGILPSGFRVPNNAITAQPDLWVPNSFQELRLERSQRSLVVFGRLRPGVTLSQARAEMIAISAQIGRENAGVTPRAAAVSGVRDDLTREFRGTFLLLQMAVAIMLLIACANVANLLLARYAARGRELALRTALGASHGQILRQLLTESIMLSLAGGAVGVLLAKWSVTPLLALVPDSAGLPFADQVAVTPAVLAFAILLSALTSVLFGLAPAHQAFRANLVETLKEAGRSGAAGRGNTLWRNMLIAGEVGLSLMLLVAAGLMVQTFWRLTKVNWGMDTARVLTVRNSLRGEAYRTPAARRNHFTAAASRLAEIPGVESVSAVSFPPPLEPIGPSRFVPSNQPLEPGRDTAAFTLVVLPDYFETIRNPILSGRSLSRADTAESSRVVVISRALAQRYFPGSPPLGQSIRMLDRNPGDWRIVGVAADVRGTGLNAAPQAVIYFPHSQAPVSTMTFVVRTRVDPLTVAATAERALWSMGRLMNVYHVSTLEQIVAESYWQSRFTMILLSVFAAVALTLASAGICAVISYLASQRTQEIGIRMVLGAKPLNVLWMVTAQGVGVAAIGVAGGILATLPLGRLIATRLYGVTASDPLTLAGVSLVLLIVAAAACIVPASRAARIDPLKAIQRD